MQLRTTPAERECKEKVNRKRKLRIEVYSAAWLNIIFSIYYGAKINWYIKTQNRS
jgi:hypothetical protein